MGASLRWVTWQQLTGTGTRAGRAVGPGLNGSIGLGSTAAGGWRVPAWRGRTAWAPEGPTKILPMDLSPGALLLLLLPLPLPRPAGVRRNMPPPTGPRGPARAGGAPAAAAAALSGPVGGVSCAAAFGVTSGSTEGGFGVGCCCCCCCWDRSNTSNGTAWPGVPSCCAAACRCWAATTPVAGVAWGASTPRGGAKVAAGRGDTSPPPRDPKAGFPWAGGSAQSALQT